MELLVTEHKTTGTLHPLIRQVVRVFVDGDMDYGYFVDEVELLALLTPEQQEYYLSRPDVTLDIKPEVAQAIIDIGVTYGREKQKVA